MSKNSGNTWGHAIKGTAPPEWATHCTHGKCKQPAVYHCTYRYITGRAGRATTRNLFLCHDHAAAFCAKHKIEGGPLTVGQVLAEAGSSAEIGGSSASSAEDGEGPQHGQA